MVYFIKTTFKTLKYGGKKSDIKMIEKVGVTRSATAVSHVVKSFDGNDRCNRPTDAILT